MSQDTVNTVIVKRNGEQVKREFAFQGDELRALMVARDLIAGGWGAVLARKSLTENDRRRYEKILNDLLHEFLPEP